MKRDRRGTRATSIAAFVALVVGAGAPRQSIAQEPAAKQAMPESAVASSADELVNGPGREKTAPCGACHGLDYIKINSRFLDLAGWTAVVNKMVKVYGAPIPPGDVETIARYLTEYYGRPNSP